MTIAPDMKNALAGGSSHALTHPSACAAQAVAQVVPGMRHGGPHRLPSGAVSTNGLYAPMTEVHGVFGHGRHTVWTIVSICAVHAVSIT